VGCGDHSYRNILPTFRYCPIELCTVCDLRPSRAEPFARLFGADQWTTRYEEVLDDERVQVVSMVMGCDKDGRVVYPELAIKALEAGKHVWIEKPPANSVDEIQQLITAEKVTGKRVACGFKKMFTPSVLRTLALIQSGRLGQPVQFAARYPQHIPSADDIANNPGAVAGFRDHLCHPTSIALRVMGKIHEFLYVREDRHGGGMMMLQFENGGVGTIHLCQGTGFPGPRERTEIVGSSGGHVVIDNNIDLTWYPDSRHKDYGRDPDFTGEPGDGAVHWTPEFSLGVLYNTGPFLLGYANELNDFCQAILNKKPFSAAGTDHMLHLTKIYEAFLNNPAGEWIHI
jgi:predicted dehydrogenase